MDRKVRFKIVISTVGAFAAYAIGSGFATGQEVLQYFASWGPRGCLVALLCSCLLMSVTWAILVEVGQANKDIEKDSDVYRYFGGDLLGKAIDYFSVVLVACVVVAVFAGAGATIQQYFGIPQFLGTLMLGVVVCCVVIMGLKRIIQVLGFLGVVFIVSIVGIGIYSILTADTGLAEASRNLPKYVEEKAVLRAGIFGIYHPVWSGLNYCGVCIVTAFPFVVALGKRTRNYREALISGASAGFCFHLPAAFASIAILLHLDYVAHYGQQVPMLAAVTEALPHIAWAYTAILLLGTFTATTGYTWFIVGRFAEEKTARYRILAVVVTVLGILIGGRLPFNLILNIVFPVTGIVGMLLGALIIYKGIRDQKKLRV